MVKVFKIDGVALPDGAILMEGGHTNLPGGIGGLPVSAWYCEPGIGTINVDDPGGDYDLEGWHTFTVDETDSTGTERQWSGWLIGRRITRGPYRDGPSRVWEVDILEINGLFNLQVFRANSAQRPAETDVERMTWMLASAPMATTPVFDDGRFSTANPANLSAADFVRSFPVDMADNAAGQSGKNVYAYWSHADDEIGFHYDLVGAGPSCTLAISNVIADKDSTTLYPFLDAELDADAYGLYTGVLLDYVGAAVYGENQTLIDDLSPTEFSPAEFKRDQMIRSDRISQSSTANAYLQTYLAAAATEKEDITVGITVPPSQVGLIEAGMNIDVKLTHIPGLEDFTTLPIIRLSKVPTPNRTDTWDVRLQLSRNVKVNLAPGGDPGGLPFEGGCSEGELAFIQSAHAVIASVGGTVYDGASWPAPPTAGNLIIACWGAKENDFTVGDPMPGWTEVFHASSFVGVGGNGGQPWMFWKIAGASEDTTPTLDTGNSSAPNGDGNSYLMEFSGVSALGTRASSASETQTTGPGVSVTPDAGVSAAIVTFLEYHTTLRGAGLPVTDAIELYNEGIIGAPGAGNPQHWVGYRLVPTTSGSLYTVNPVAFNAPGVKWGSISAAFICEPVPPGVGTGRVHEFIANGDSATVTFSTDFPYAPGSLRVFVDGVPIINGLTETNPTTGSFTLDFPPQGAVGDTRAEIVTASYQVGTT